METRRFLMVTTHYPPRHIGGDAVYVQNLSEELVRRGHEVHVASCPQVFDIVRRNSPQRNEEPARVADAPVVHPIRLKSPRLATMQSHTLGMWGNAERTLRNLISEVKPDVIHWNNTKAFIGTPFPSEGAVNIYTAHDFFASCPKSSLLRPSGNVCAEPSFCQLCLIRSSKVPQLWRMGGRRVLDISSDFRVISPSAFLAQVIASDGIRVSHLVPTFAPDPNVSPGGNQEDRNSVVFVGILEPHKGPQVLLEAFAASAQQHDLTLDIIGEGSLRGELTRRASNLPQRDRIRIPGRVNRNELSAAMKRARAVIVPSIWYENCPLSALEALSFGVPVIASNIGGLPEIATADAGSRTFTPGNHQELARELVRIHDNRLELGEQMRLARNAYEERYSPGRHISMYMKVLSSA